MDYDDLANRARAALIMAAMRRSTVTYGELARAIDFDPSVPPSHHMKRVLDIVTDECDSRGEPSLAPLVVNERTGEPGKGYQPNGEAWHKSVRRCFNAWSPA
ncbi:helix-turn-helix transcriptional regulator [Nocardioides pinisoli]|uniref:ArsR family transcriptional regulator n=1 Tax=Nocardioides pinisoli TaxID=2950279 RepID=A0ABT1KRH7_9ACTN|nr:helix-turn-helix transcriptional regulator [Nocardioides pinisoli]MCP3420345.1 ArsR family transcriptional regulator [Nocardioides pinisoli]